MSVDRRTTSAFDRLRGWGVNLLLFCVAVALCLGVAEVAARVFFKNELLYPRYHTDASYGEYVLRRLRPNSVFRYSSPGGSWKFVTNSQGFRDEEDYAYEKPDNVVRVLSLGDSHTQGFEVRQDRTYSEVMERFLNAHGIKAQVLNTGVSGFGTAEQLAFLENEGIRYEPDFAVVGFFANDFEDNIKAGLFELRDSELVPVKNVHIPGVRILNVVNSFAPLRWLSENSYLYSVALNAAWSWGKKLLLSESEARLQTEFAISSEKVTDYKKDLVVHLIKRMNDFCLVKGCQLIILDLPQPNDRSGQFIPSIPADLASDFRANSHAFIASETALGEYRDTAEFHVPSGQHHISEFTHLKMGMEAGREILEAYRQDD